MLRSLIAFCLSRRPLVLIAFAAFLGARLRRVPDAEHRGLSRSGAADHRDHRAVARPVAGGGRALRHDPDRDRGRQHAGPEVHPLQHGVRARLHPPAVRIRPRLPFRAPAGAQPAEGRGAAGRRAAGDLARRQASARSSATSSSGRRAWTSCELQDAAGLGGRAPAAHRARRRRRAGARRQDQGIPGRDRSQPHDGLRPDAAADHHRDLGRATPMSAAAPSRSASSRSTCAASASSPRSRTSATSC